MADNVNIALGLASLFVLVGAIWALIILWMIDDFNRMIDRLFGPGKKEDQDD